MFMETEIVQFRRKKLSQIDKIMMEVKSVLRKNQEKSYSRGVGKSCRSITSQMSLSRRTKKKFFVLSKKTQKNIIDERNPGKTEKRNVKFWEKVVKQMKSQCKQRESQKFPRFQSFSSENKQIIWNKSFSKINSQNESKLQIDNAKKKIMKLPEIRVHTEANPQENTYFTSKEIQDLRIDPIRFDSFSHEPAKKAQKIFSKKGVVKLKKQRDKYIKLKGKYQSKI